MKKNFLLDVVLFISGILCIVTGILMDFHIVPGGWETRHLVRLIHTYSGYVMAIGIIFHIAWHVSWIKATIKKFSKKQSSKENF